MSQTPLIDIKKALETKLKELFPTTAIAWESVDFKPPAKDSYFRTQFIIQRPDDPVLGSKYYRERATFQVFVFTPVNIGTGAGLLLAEQIRQGYDKGSFFLENGTRIHVNRTPQIAGTAVVNDRLMIPVLIDVWAEVYKD